MLNFNNFEISDLKIDQSPHVAIDYFKNFNRINNYYLLNSILIITEGLDIIGI